MLECDCNLFNTYYCARDNCFCCIICKCDNKICYSIYNSNNKKLMKGKALRKHSLHEKTAASVLSKLFLSGNE